MGAMNVGPSPQVTQQQFDFPSNQPTMSGHSGPPSTHGGPRTPGSSGPPSTTGGPRTPTPGGLTTPAPLPATSTPTPSQQGVTSQPPSATALVPCSRQE